MISITDTDIEHVLKCLLQQNLKFCLKNKTWREGKLILFKQSGYYLEMIIQNKKLKNERFEIPIPFGINTQLKNKIVFDYQIDTLVGKRNKKLIELLKCLNPSTKNKFYNMMLDIIIT